MWIPCNSWVLSGRLIDRAISHFKVTVPLFEYHKKYAKETYNERLEFNLEHGIIAITFPEKKDIAVLNFNTIEDMTRWIMRD